MVSIDHYLPASVLSNFSKITMTDIVGKAWTNISLMIMSDTDLERVMVALHIRFLSASMISSGFRTIKNSLVSEAAESSSCSNVPAVMIIYCQLFSSHSSFDLLTQNGWCDQTLMERKLRLMVVCIGAAALITYCSFVCLILGVEAL